MLKQTTNIQAAAKDEAEVKEINQKGVYSGFLGRRLYEAIQFGKDKELLSAAATHTPAKFENEKSKGIIVLPANTSLAANDIANWLKQKENLVWSIGHYFAERFKTEAGTVFDKTSLSVQIDNANWAQLRAIAMQMRQDFQAKGVLIKDFSAEKIWG